MTCFQHVLNSIPLICLYVRYFDQYIDRFFNYLSILIQNCQSTLEFIAYDINLNDLVHKYLLVLILLVPLSLSLSLSLSHSPSLSLTFSLSLSHSSVLSVSIYLSIYLSWLLSFFVTFALSLYLQVCIFIQSKRFFGKITIYPNKWS